MSLAGSAPPDASTPVDRRRIAELIVFCDRMAWWLDDCLRIPGTGFRLGLDAAIGLIPLAGDAVGFTVSALTIVRAVRAGVPRHLLMKMARNVVIDAVGSFIPMVGDLFDTVFKAHRRNFALLRAHYATEVPAIAAKPRRSLGAAIVTTVVLGAIAYGIARLI